MPYQVVKDGDQFCVQKEDGTAVKGGCHPTKADAEDMMKAMYASEKKEAAQTKERLFDQVEVKYTPVSLQVGKACAGCRWFEPAENWGDESRTPECHLVQSWPQSIQPTGYCDRYEVYPAPNPFTQTPMPVVIVDPETIDTGMAEAKEKALFGRIVDSIKDVFSRKETDETTGFKVAGNHWLATWSNNFEDRDGEVFSAKAIDDFVARVDMGLTPPPELWVWHQPGTRIGQAEWVDRHGHFLMALGTFDDTPQAQQAKAFYQKQAGKKSLSHGFTFPASALVDGVYHQFNTFEISLLPRGAEANLYTSLEGVKAMAKVMSEAKKAELFAVFGEDVGARILAAEEAKGKALEDLGVATKDFSAVIPTTVDAAKEAVDKADKAFSALVPDLMEGSAEAVSAALEAVKAVKELRTENATLRKELTDAVAALNERLDGAPRRASRDIKTRLAKDDPAAQLLDKSLEQERLEGGKVLGGLFRNGSTPD